jgi:hypothetical protein
MPSGENDIPLDDSSTNDDSSYGRDKTTLHAQ